MEIINNIDELTDIKVLKYIASINKPKHNPYNDRYPAYPIVLKCYERCYELGDVEHIYEIASIYKSIDNNDKALKWYELGRERKDVKCIIGLGHLYCLVKNYQKAFEYYKEAKELGSDNAVEFLAQMYIDGNIPRDIGKSSKYYYYLMRKGYQDIIYEQLLAVMGGTKTILKYMVELREKNKEQEKIITDLMLRPPELGGPDYEKVKTDFSTLNANSVSR